MRPDQKQELPFMVLKTGRWWGNNPSLKREEEIDLIGINNIEKKMILGECKYRNEKLSLEVITKLEERGTLLSGHWQQSFILFSKSGFTNAALEYAKKKGILLVALEDMYLTI